MDFKREESHALTAGGGDGRDLSLMSALDYTAIEEMDPSIADGYRVIYEIYEDRITIEVIRVGHRRDVYRKK